MKKNLILFILLLSPVALLQAQTWNGSAGTDWNTAANWTPATVPGPGSSVTIPSTANKPVFANNVTLTAITTALGSAIDFNGFTLTVSGSFDINGSTLNNSNAGTDIEITISGGGVKYFRQNIVNDHIIFNCNNSTDFREGFTFPDTFNGDATFNIGGTGTFYTSYDKASAFNGSVTINRTVAGTTNIFDDGATGVAGNFSYTNNAGGATNIHAAGLNVLVPITGTINITATGAGNPAFLMRRIQNQTTGGTISVQNSGLVTISYDTLVVTAFNVNGYTGGGSDEFYQNSITGTVNISDAASNTGNIYFRGNTVTGNTTIACNGSVEFREAWQLPDTFNGDATFNIGGIATFYTSYDNVSAFNGNVTINRTVAGTTNIFNTGATGVAGNFSYTNNAGGATNIHVGGASVTIPITGTINIAATGAGNPAFLMRYIKNQTAGGTISVQNSGLVTILYDTLVVTAFNVNGFTGGGSDEFYQNSITGTVNISDAATNTGNIYFRGNTVTGNTTIACNGSVEFREGWQLPDTFNGDATFNIGGIATFYTSYDKVSAFNGNVTVNRTVAGSSYIFSAGATGVAGNFSYTNNAGGLTNINGAGAASSIPVTGTINITATGTGNPAFLMRYIKNQTAGGTISVQNSGLVTILYDTLVVTAFNVNGYTGAGTDDFLQNSITGTVNISDAATNTGNHYFRGNTVTGNTTITCNSATAPFRESFVFSDTFNGNASFVRNAGTVSLSYDHSMTVNQNLTLNSTAGITFTDSVNFKGSSNGIIAQLGTQPIIMPKILIEKTGSGNITLNDSVTVSTKLTFNGGNIISSAANFLKILDNSTNSGSSATSHVIGPVVKVGDDVFTFPLGTATSHNTIGITAPSGVTSSFKAEYKNQNPGSDGYDANSKAGTLTNVSHAGYWNVDRLIGASNVNLTLGFGTNPYEQYPVLANLKVAEWSGTQWDDKGNAGTTGTAAAGTVSNSTPLTYNGQFALANVAQTYFYVYGTPGPGPDGTPVKFTGIGGYPTYMTRQLPAGSYSADSIYLIPNGTSASFKLKDSYNVDKDDTTVTVVVAPTVYISANGNGTINFTGWRHFVYMTDGSNNIMGAIKDNDLTLGNTTMTAYFSTASVATASNGNKYLKRSFKITSQFAPVGTKRVRFYISKTEFNNLVAADPASFPGGITSLTIIKYTGPQEDSLFDPIPGGNSIIIPNSDITIADLGTMYSLDIDVTGFSGFYISGNNSNLNICTGSTIAIPSDISGSTYQWQVDDGSGYVNITNTGIYSGATTKTVTLTNIPGSMYGYNVRCLVNGVTPSQVYTIKFKASWLGAASDVWENAANWSCGQLPDANTDVVLNAGKPNYPVLNSNATVRSLEAKPGTTLNVKTGFALTIVK